MRKVINRGISFAKSSEGDVVEMCETKEEAVEKYGYESYLHSTAFGDSDCIGLVDGIANGYDKCPWIQVYAGEIEEIN